MLNKEIFISNLSEISKGMTQKEIAAIMGCTEGTMSRYMNPQRKEFPPVDGLCNLSEHFNVSIDWLVGNTEKRKKDGKLSPRDICAMLIDIFTTSQCTFKELTVTEDCFDEPWDSDKVVHSSRENTYPIFYFSEWRQIDIEMYYSDFMDSGNRHRINSIINNFIDRYLKIKSMLDEGNLETEMYEILLNRYLQDVPDK